MDNARIRPIRAACELRDGIRAARDPRAIRGDGGVSDRIGIPQAKESAERQCPV
jgi:hypothetical protein